MANSDTMSTVLKLDRASTVDFLASIAGVLAQKDCITQKDTDSLRLVLSSLQTSPSKSESLIIDLISQDAEFIHILENRFGVVGLHQNLTRYAIRQVINEFIMFISEFGEQLVTKSQTFLNRQAMVYVGSSCYSRTLFSSLLIEFAADFAQCCDIFSAAHSNCFKFSGSAYSLPSGDDEAIDTAIAKSLGFHVVVNSSALFSEDSKILQNIGNGLTIIASSVDQFTDMIQKNFKGNSAARIKLLNEYIKLDAAFIGSFNLFGEFSFEGCEIRRIRLLSTLAACLERFKTISGYITETLSNVSAMMPQTIYTDDIRRQIASDLLKKGVNIKLAENAARNLLEYCSVNKISPAQMLLGEVNKADSNLVASSLELLQKYHDESSISKSLTSKKSAISESSRKLLSTFRQNTKSLGTTMILFLVMSGLFSCGLKTMPKSEVLDPKPAIPFRLYKPAKQINLNEQKTDQKPENKTQPEQPPPQR